MKINANDFKAIGKRVKWARLDLKITQEYVARKLDVGVQHISNVERGVIGISFETFYGLTKLLDCSADYLMFGTSMNIKNSLNEVLNKLNPQQRIYAEEFLRLYAKSCGIEIQ